MPRPKRVGNWPTKLQRGAPFSEEALAQLFDLLFLEDPEQELRETIVTTLNATAENVPRDENGRHVFAAGPTYGKIRSALKPIRDRYAEAIELTRALDLDSARSVVIAGFDGRVAAQYSMDMADVATGQDLDRSAFDREKFLWADLHMLDAAVSAFVQRLDRVLAFLEPRCGPGKRTTREMGYLACAAGEFSDAFNAFQSMPGESESWHETELETAQLAFVRKALDLAGLGIHPKDEIASWIEAWDADPGALRHAAEASWTQFVAKFAWLPARLTRFGEASIEDPDVDAPAGQREASDSLDRGP